MKFSVTLLQILISTNVISSKDPICNQRKEAKYICNTKEFKRFYYDNALKKCKELTQENCSTYVNMFSTKEDCQYRCEPDHINPCKQPAEKGKCTFYMTRYYYDSELGECKEFRYGGCEGNKNNFDKKEDCERKCDRDRDNNPCKQPKKEGPCKAGVLRYYYDRGLKQCTKFTYGGCEGNDNNFATMTNCELRCQRGRPDRCKQPSESGLCYARFPLFYYDTELRKCKQFIYGGCQGNDNKFLTEQACINICARVPFNPCNKPPEVGPCDQALNRYYYDVDAKKCRLFSYSGCGGNFNNFLNKEACEEDCHDVEPESKIVGEEMKNETFYFPVI